MIVVLVRHQVTMSSRLHSLLQCFKNCLDHVSYVALHTLVADSRRQHVAMIVGNSPSCNVFLQKIIVRCCDLALVNNQGTCNIKGCGCLAASIGAFWYLMLANLSFNVWKCRWNHQQWQRWWTCWCLEWLYFDLETLRLWRLQLLAHCSSICNGMPLRNSLATSSSKSCFHSTELSCVTCTLCNIL